MSGEEIKLLQKDIENLVSLITEVKQMLQVSSEKTEANTGDIIELKTRLNAVEEDISGIGKRIDRISSEYNEKVKELKQELIDTIKESMKSAVSSVKIWILLGMVSTGSAIVYMFISKLIK